MRSLVSMPEEAGFALDPQWIRINPYQIQASLGGQAELCVEVHNHGRQVVTASVEIVAPDGWRVEPGRCELAIPVAQEGRCGFTLSAPSEDTGPATRVICATIELDDGVRRRRFGPNAEALVHLSDSTF